MNENAVQTYISVGKHVQPREGARWHTLRNVSLYAEDLGYHRYTHDGRTYNQTLYQTDDDRFVVYTIVHYEEKEVGEVDLYTLKEITLQDLQPGGSHEALGHACRMESTLTLDEGIEYSRHVQ